MCNLLGALYKYRGYSCGDKINWQVFITKKNYQSVNGKSLITYHLLHLLLRPNYFSCVE